MQISIEQLVQKQKRLTEQRISRALTLMEPFSQDVFNQLPMLLHFNHEELPGFTEDAPCGIKQFQFNSEQHKWIEHLPFDNAFYSLNQTIKQESILGLYTMGSTSSIGQTANSDLDIWVCIPDTLTAKQKSDLQRKCDTLTQWAGMAQVEVSFFLMETNYFRHTRSEEMTRDNCGSSQHLLLLDEFYRTSVCLAGQPLLWQIIPPEEENNYDAYVSQLCQRGDISCDEWIDFGPLVHIPAEEYFGSNLWQLYKSIDFPFKSVLKATLLEAYSWEYPNTQLLSFESKRLFFESSDDLHDIKDAYYLILEKVTNYLQKIGDTARLNLVRKSFYLKTHEKISRELNQNSVAWRRNELTQLTAQWGWDNETIVELDNRRHWKVEQVQKVHNELLESFMLSYRNLIRFARNNNITSSISPEDISVLARKLYAAFEDFPGKVPLLNPRISPDLHEIDLSFIEVSENRTNKAGWYIYKQPLVAEKLIGSRYLEYSTYLSKLVAWAFFNGLLTESSRLHAMIHNSDLNIDKFYQMVSDLRSTFSITTSRPSKEELASPCSVRQLSIFINLESDPTEHLNLNNIDASQLQKERNILSYSDDQHNLIGSIDLVYRNSWHEVRTLNFSGEKASLDALKTILCKMHKDAERPEIVDVFCYSKHLSRIIRNEFYHLLNECIELRLKPIEKHQKRRRFKGLKIGSTMYGLFFERRGVSIQELKDSVQFYSSISTNKAIGTIHKPVERRNIVIPDIVDSFASEGLIQFFFDDRDNSFNIYVLDEENNVDVYYDCNTDKEDMVNTINHYHTSNRHHTNSRGVEKINFNLPQFYEVLYDDNKEPFIYPYRSSNHHSKLA